jgi:thioredoxin reductase
VREAEAFGNEARRPVDTLIVGGGPAGLAAARFLADEGRSATVLFLAGCYVDTEFPATLAEVRS